jgi:hypothetical protein
MENIFESAATIHEKRVILKKLSKPLQELSKIGKIESVNAGLKTIYKSDGHIILKTFNQWKKDGKSIKKGEKALCLWGAPKHKGEADEQCQDMEGDKLDFYPICYVFSNLQVQ